MVLRTKETVRNHSTALSQYLVERIPITLSVATREYRIRHSTHVFIIIHCQYRHTIYRYCPHWDHKDQGVKKIWYNVINLRLIRHKKVQCIYPNQKQHFYVTLSHQSLLLKNEKLPTQNMLT